MLGRYLCAGRCVMLGTPPQGWHGPAPTELTV